MKILYENEVNSDMSKLDQAWKNDETFAFISNRSGCPEDWVRTALSNLPLEFNKDHFVLFTSGSTGRPKLVVGKKERAEHLAKVLHEIQDSHSVNQTVLLLPLTYSYAFVNQWLWAKLHNRKIIYSGGFSKPDLVKKYLEEAADCLLCLVGAMLPLLKSNFGEHICFPGVTRLHFAGGMFPQESLPLIEKIFPNALIFNNYGCAEAMPRLTIRKAGETNIAHNIGRPIPGVNLKIGDEGEILFQSIYRASCYYDHTGLHIPSDDDWIPTGDFGEQIENGYWLIRGRKSEVFKRYGEKISFYQLLETVKVYWTHDAVFYRENDSSGEPGHVLLLSPNADEDQVRNILREFRKNYARALWPLRIESVENIPLLPNGKIDNIRFSSIPKTIHWMQRI